MLWASAIGSQWHRFILQILAFLVTPMYHIYSAYVSQIIHCNATWDMKKSNITMVLKAYLQMGKTPLNGAKIDNMTSVILQDTS